MWRYSDNLRGAVRNADVASDLQHAVVGRQRVTDVLTAARTAGRTLLTEFESKQVLAAYGIPTVETRIAATADESVAAAEAIGYPVVVETAFRNDHAQDRRRRRRAQPGDRRRGPPGL